MKDIQTRSKAHVNAYLILVRDRRVLMYLRKNTGYLDGWYGLVSGHIEDGESATEGLVREATEEAGIKISQKDLKFVHCLHRQTDRLNVDLFFLCNSWDGEIQNREPQKCGDLRFFPVDSLPENTVAYISDVLEALAEGKFYSEQGWV